MKNLFRLLGIIALVALIGFSFAALSLTGCDTGGGGKDTGGGKEPEGGTLASQINGTWKGDDGTEITLTNGNFVHSENNKQSMKGTYTAGARSISATITMIVTEIHGNYLTEIFQEEMDITFENKWYNKNQLTDALKKWMKDEGVSDADINEALSEMSSFLDLWYSTITGIIDGDKMTLTAFGETTTYTKEGGSTNPGGSSGGWTVVTNSTFGDSDIVQAIAYGNGKFVASSGNKIATSTDGITWTAGNASISNHITFGNGKFVASRGNKIATSTDGITWTAVANSTFANLGDGIEAIAFGNGTFVAGGTDGPTGYYKMAYSSDGVTWTAAVNVNENYGSLNAIAFGNGTFVAVGEGGYMRYSSDNGATWTKVANTTFGITSEIYSIAYGNGKFVAVGGSHEQLSTSPDGVTWTVVKNNVLGGSIIYANNKFVAVGKGKIATSPDGVTWTDVNVDSIFEYDYIYNGTTYKTHYWLNAIAFGNGTFVVVGDGGTIAYSTGN